MLPLSLFCLAVEAAEVINLRLLKIGWGEDVCGYESRLMVCEKISAACEATANLMTGGSVSDVVDRYREHVDNNRRRLGN